MGVDRDNKSKLSIVQFHQNIGSIQTGSVIFFSHVILNEILYQYIVIGKSQSGFLY